MKSAEYNEDLNKNMFCGLIDLWDGTSCKMELTLSDLS